MPSSVLLGRLGMAKYYDFDSDYLIERKLASALRGVPHTSRLITSE